MNIKRLFTVVCLITIVLIFSIANISGACNKPSGIPQFDLDSYYQSAIGKTGDLLKSELNKIIKKHHRHSYSCVWNILRESDEDPDNPDNVILLYTGRSQDKSRRDQGGNDQNAWNREHVWAKSHGFKSKGQHAHTDAHHLRPTDKSVNADRGNKDFANGGSSHNECIGCKSTSITWEPPDSVKGDVARMMFYMVVRYEGEDQSSTPDLELVERSTFVGSPRFGKLCDLYGWHKQDQVSDWEKNRNSVVYSWQGNRNPFIDHPEFVQAIWGEKCQDTDPIPPPVEPDPEIPEPEVPQPIPDNPEPEEPNPTDKEKLDGIIKSLEEILKELRELRE